MCEEALKCLYLLRRSWKHCCVLQRKHYCVLQRKHCCVLQTSDLFFSHSVTGLYTLSCGVCLITVIEARDGDLSIYGSDAGGEMLNTMSVI